MMTLGLISECSGNVNQKVLPLPTSDSAPISPPSLFTIVLQIESPSPLPFLSLCKRTKRSKTPSNLSAEIPEPDIILMDIRMPEVNGYEATEAIRQMSATVPIIALTAFAYEEDRQKIMHSGFTDFLTKPISSKVLLGKLESLKKI